MINPTIDDCIAHLIDQIKANDQVGIDRVLRHNLRLLEWLRTNADLIKSIDQVLKTFPGSLITAE
jgi:hypothetical protein